jgi:hypothetical protein
MERRSIFLEGVFDKLGAVGRRGSFKTSGRVMDSEAPETWGV